VQVRHWEAVTTDEFQELARLGGLSRRRTIATVTQTVDRMKSVWPTVRETEAFDDAIRVAIDRQMATVPLFVGAVSRRTRSPRVRMKT
jgi:hypothetical protein